MTEETGVTGRSPRSAYIGASEPRVRSRRRRCLRTVDGWTFRGKPYTKWVRFYQECTGLGFSLPGCSSASVLGQTHRGTRTESSLFHRPSMPSPPFYAKFTGQISVAYGLRIFKSAITRFGLGLVVHFGPDQSGLWTPFLFDQLKTCFFSGLGRVADWPP